MTAELDPFAAAPELMKHWVRTSIAIASSLDPKLVGLVEIRASQINGCANCLNMHAAEARAKGKTGRERGDDGHQHGGHAQDHRVPEHFAE